MMSGSVGISFLWLLSMLLVYIFYALSHVMGVRGTLVFLIIRCFCDCHIYICLCLCEVCLYLCLSLSLFVCQYLSLPLTVCLWLSFSVSLSICLYLHRSLSTSLFISMPLSMSLCKSMSMMASFVSGSTYIHVYISSISVYLSSLSLSIFISMYAYISDDLGISSV